MHEVPEGYKEVFFLRGELYNESIGLVLVDESKQLSFVSCTKRKNVLTHPYNGCENHDKIMKTLEESGAEILRAGLSVVKEWSRGRFRNFVSGRLVFRNHLGENHILVTPCEAISLAIKLEKPILAEEGLLRECVQDKKIFERWEHIHTPHICSIIRGERVPEKRENVVVIDYGLERMMPTIKFVADKTQNPVTVLSPEGDEEAIGICFSEKIALLVLHEFMLRNILLPRWKETGVEALPLLRAFPGDEYHGDIPHVRLGAGDNEVADETEHHAFFGMGNMTRINQLREVQT